MAAARVARAYTPAAMEEPVPDEALMLRYAQGDAEAFDALYARHRAGLWRYLLRQLRSRSQTEEVFQDIWMNLISARGRYRVEAKFSTWLYTMAHNRVIDYFRRHRPLQTVSVDGDEDAPEIPASSALQPERVAEGRQQAKRLLVLVEALPLAQREALLLHQEAGLTVDEIARVTASDREAIKSRLRYAMDRLRKGMEEFR